MRCDAVPCERAATISIMRFMLPFLIAAAIAGARHAVPLQAIAAVEAATQAAPSAPATAPSPSPAAPVKRLVRNFHAGEELHYRVRLTVRNEVEKPDPAQTSAAAATTTAPNWAEVQLAWVVSERVESVTPEGSARIEEQLEKFSAPAHSRSSGAKDDDAAKLAGALGPGLTEWARDRILEFRVGPNGLASEISGDGAPTIDESKPLLLTLWLNHALRPQVTLPARPVRPGESWQEPRRIRVVGWMDVHAEEKDEWLEAVDAEGAAVRLRAAQKISGRLLENASSAPPRAGEEEGERRPFPRASNKTETFQAESLSTIALDDGRVLAASRSAQREIVEELPPTQGTTLPRRSRATLSVQVEIEPCVGTECNEGTHR